MALIGYAQVSTSDPRQALQHDALNAAGCERVFDEHGTSTVWDDLFATDDAAHAVFRQTVDEEDTRAFLDQAIVIPFRR